MPSTRVPAISHSCNNTQSPKMNVSRAATVSQRSLETSIAGCYSNTERIMLLNLL